ncbi:ATP-binding cassette domain-containing protein [Bosea caraganae]|uniref:ATP-binding cassette domain-containing protein n=1 Tax=Bosea caraganae TaxID=2763117 RepID=A0A370L1A8_9HYPH|nr:ATP-binding cassette domain-containing protein [Bosea caraganae]RDJ21241.1 ATP-binding cassette domain-containing protein [Bosea caraganae]RDJ26381.1 ATP-binding cassette domain-containing protein [Bosea caraganae]
MTTAILTQTERSFDALFEDRSAKARASRGQAVTIRHLGKRFGELEVLRGIDLDIPAGQFLAIVGRSGCGKSTLLRILAGLDQPSSGSLSFSHGATDAAVKPRIMFQEPRLLPWQRVLANVEVGLGAERSLPEAEERAFQTLRAVGLEAKAKDWPSVLSGGQRQRVALARALVSRPRVLALDEPLGALDALTRIEMQGLLERVWQAQGFTAILVTHDVAEALTLADRVVMIDEGRISLDIAVDLPRPRRRGSVEIARLEERILKDLIREETPPPEYTI